ncbi:2,3-diphosphoglycerate-dependent phosphoglycerate mutase [Candidatus Gracilibacteria bacterium CG17_big_fil_post_rev_8_21_14_2_50_48_13]|nr:MAG: 2,3-diphosphoglycerate-dependent phosphoglycerate mutase [Candidatus Gracilibacteria bacterium CG17_big_fil_post_rev_8_21_14_2_50_48_13]
MGKLILLRHGESLWNKENRFTGWVDVDLTEKGREEAKHAGWLLKDANLVPEVAFTSYLQRAIKTLHIMLEEMDLLWIPETKAWQLNERHYGDLQGKNKAETMAAFGEEQVHIWRRSFDVAPPVLSMDSPMHPMKDPRYANSGLPTHAFSESLKDTVARAVPYFDAMVLPLLREGKTVLIAAHGNSLRAIIKKLEGISDADIPLLELATGAPRLYEFDAMGTVKDRQLLGDR